jgi:hypothetical protein
LVEEILHLELCLSCDWPSSRGDLFKAMAFDAAITPDNTEQREWLIENHPLYAHFSRKIREKSADVWIALMRAMIAIEEGRLAQAERHFKDTNKLCKQLGNMRPNTEAKQDAQSKGGNASAGKHTRVMQHCAQLILGSDTTKGDLHSMAALAERLSPPLMKYMRDHRDELQGSQVENHANNDDDDLMAVELIKRWLYKADSVVREAYGKRRKLEGLSPR